MSDSSILVKQFDGSNYSQYFPQNIPPDIINQFVNVSGTNSNDVFNYLGKYCQYWWEKSLTRTNSFSLPVNTNITAEVMIAGIGVTRTISYAKEITVNDSKISLVSPKSITINANYKKAESLAELSPCYITNCEGNPSAIYYLKSNTTGGTSARKYTIYIKTTYVKDDPVQSIYLGTTTGPIPQIVSLKQFQNSKKETSFVNSIERDAFPDSGEKERYQYSFLGVPLEIIASNASLKIQTGQYIGAGTYLEDNPNFLSLSPMPKFLLIQNNLGGNDYNLLMAFPQEKSNVICIYKAGYTNQSLMATTLVTKYSDTNIMWYVSNSDTLSMGPRYQGNIKGAVYSYIAFS